MNFIDDPLIQMIYDKLNPFGYGPDGLDIIFKSGDHNNDDWNNVEKIVVHIQLLRNKPNSYEVSIDLKPQDIEKMSGEDIVRRIKITKQTKDFIKL